MPLMLKLTRSAWPIASVRCAKLEPQPQPAAALGFSTLNAAPPSDSTKSTVQPATSSRLTGSTTSRTPSVSLTESSASALSARSNLYWKPEQPPPSTDSRRIAGLPCLRAIAPTRFAADSVRVRARCHARDVGRRGPFAQAVRIYSRIACGLGLDQLEPVLDQVADRDERDQPVAVEHRQVADAPQGHHFQRVAHGRCRDRQ